MASSFPSQKEFAMSFFGKNSNNHFVYASELECDGPYVCKIYDFNNKVTVLTNGEKLQISNLSFNSLVKKYRDI